jgi:hypothetical protein
LWTRWFRENWSQGEHVSLIGPTGRGKTSLALPILALQDSVVVLAIKQHDPVIEQFYARGYRIVEQAEDIVEHLPLSRPTCVILWIKPNGMDRKATHEQSEQISTALNDLYRVGGWCVFLDDLGHLTGHLKLASDVTVLLVQGRSSGISAVCAMTQPRSVSARVPSESLRQCTHMLIFRYTNTDEVRSCAQISGIEFKRMREIQQKMKGHDFLYSGKDVCVLVRNTD